MERKNKVTRKVEAGIKTNELRSFLKSLDFLKSFFVFLINTQIMEFFFMLIIFYVVPDRPCCGFK